MQSTPEIRAGQAAHHVCFALFGLIAVLALWAPWTALVSLSSHDDRYSHILFMPLIGLAVLYLERKRIFNGLRFSPVESLPFFVAAIAAYLFFRGASSSTEPNDVLWVAVVCLITSWMAGFVLCYGARCFRAATFPLLLLLLMIPVPGVLLDKTVLLLQKGSASVAYRLFRVLGVPVFWSGFTFSLPGVDIEIAKECSGIRSTISLLVTGVVAGHVFLRSGWRKILLSLLTIPVAIFKNAVRIVTISSLGVYVDRSFLFGKLHHYGGVPFALVALAILGPALLLLQRGEARGKVSQPAGPQDRESSSGTPALASRA